MSTKTRVLVALAVGAVFGVITPLFIDNPVLPDWVGKLTIVLMPGYIAGIVASRNVHNPSSFVGSR